MKKIVPWIDVLVFGGIDLIILVLCTLAAFTQQEWPLGKIIAFSATPVLTTAIALLVILTKYFSKPDFTTIQGTMVWNDGIFGLNFGTHEKVLDFFIETLPKFAREINVIVEPIELKRMLDGAKVEWRTKPISMYALGWQVKDAAGLQQGKSVVVHWKGSIVESALFHELLHMVDEIIFTKEPDYKHDNILWWAIDGKLCEELRKRYSSF